MPVRVHFTDGHHEDFPDATVARYADPVFLVMRVDRLMSELIPLATFLASGVVWAEYVDGTGEIRLVFGTGGHPQ